MKNCVVKKFLVALTLLILVGSSENAKKKRTLEKMLQDAEDKEIQEKLARTRLASKLPPSDPKLNSQIFQMSVMSQKLCFPAKEKALGCCQFDPESFATEKSVLCFYSNGRLGNQISSYASLYAMAKIMNLRPLVYRENHDYLSKYFQHIEIGIIEEEFCQPCDLPWIRLSSLLDDPQRLERDYQQGKAIVKMDYLQYPGMYLEYLPELRTIFKPNDFHQSRATETILNHLNGTTQGFVLVGIHVRRTDFFQMFKRRQSDNEWNLALITYFDQARAYFRDQFPNQVRFLVVGDDPIWNQEHLSADEDTLVIGTSGDINVSGEDQVGIDFSILLNCDHIIMSFGTFGMWAGLLVGGETIMVDSSDHYNLQEPDLMKAHGAPGFHFIKLKSA